MLQFNDLTKVSTRAKDLQKDYALAYAEFAEERRELMNLPLLSIKQQVKATAEKLGLEFSVQEGDARLVSDSYTDFISLGYNQLKALGSDASYSKVVRFTTSIKDLVSLTYTIGFAKSTRFTAEGDIDEAQELRLVPVVRRDLNVTEGSKLTTADYTEPTIVEPLSTSTGIDLNVVAELLTTSISAADAQKQLDNALEYMAQELEPLLTARTEARDAVLEFKDNVLESARAKAKSTEAELTKQLEQGLSRERHERIVNSAMLEVGVNRNDQLVDGQRGDRIFENIFPCSETRAEVTAMKLLKAKRKNSRNVEVVFTYGDGEYVMVYDRSAFVYAIHCVSEHIATKSILELLGDFEINK